MRHDAWRRLESPWAGPLVVAIFAFVLFAPSVVLDYALDDRHALLSHPAVLGDVPLGEVFVREYWGRPIGGGEWSSSYRPLTTLTFAIEHRITAAAWLHHLSNCLWFSGLSFAVTRVARRWCSARIAVGVGLVFAALPIHVESVASIVGRADVLAALSALVSAHLALPREGVAARPRAIAGAAVLYLVALLCKETVALLPAIVGVLVAAQLRARPQMRRWPQAASTIVLGLVGAAYLLVRHHALSVELPGDFVPADNLLIQRHGIGRVWGNLGILGHYTELTLVPVRLCSDHTYADIVPARSAWSAEAMRAWLGVLVALVVVRDAIGAWRGRSPGLWVALAVAFLLVGQWIIDLSVIVAERLALWPSVWLAFALGHVAEGRTDLPARARRNLRIGFALLLALLAIRSVERTFDWRDDLTLHRAAVRVCPRAVHSRFILAGLEREHGNVHEAVWHYALTGAGRAAFPGEFDVPALEVEDVMPLEERLRRLPELVGAPDAAIYWRQLHGYLAGEGFGAEARLVADLARGGP